jgi:hypothetical protein
MPTYRKKFEAGDIVAVIPPNDFPPFLMTVAKVGITRLHGTRGENIYLPRCEIVPVLGQQKCENCMVRLPKVTHNKRFCVACAQLNRSAHQVLWNRKYREDKGK